MFICIFALKDECEACCVSVIEGGIAWPETASGTTARTSCFQLHTSFNPLSEVKRFCHPNGSFDTIDFSGCTFKENTENIVLIFQGSLSILSEIESLERAAILEVFCELLVVDIASIIQT